MTKRRLINKKAYDEILLLKQLLKSDDWSKYIVSIQVDENDNENFVINHYKNEEWIATIVGEDYTVISKMVIVYLNKQ